KTKGFVRDAEFKEFKDSLATKYETAQAMREEIISKHGIRIFEQALHLTVIDVERHYLEELYVNNEVSEDVYRLIVGKLTLQREKIEAAQEDDITPSAFRDRKDIFDRLMGALQNRFLRRPSQLSPLMKLQYYRAQMIMARKA